MGKWATILKMGKRVATSDAVRNTGASVGNAVIHPQRTLVGAGTAVKTAVVGGGAGYLAWENLVNDKPVVRAVSDVVIGEEATDRVLDTTSTATERLGAVAEGTGETLRGISDSLNSMSQSWNGISQFIGNITSGNGLNMFGNFFSNLGRGKVSGLGILGLVASAFLVFGRFGWLGKIGGLLMGMMLIGNNSRLAQAQAPAVDGGTAGRRR